MPDDRITQKVAFTNRGCRVLAFALLYVLLLWYAVLTVATGAIFSAVQALLILSVFFLLLKRKPTARMALQLWSFFTLIFPATFKIISKVLISSAQDQDPLSWSALLINLLILLVGGALLLIATRCTEIVSATD